MIFCLDVHSPSNLPFWSFLSSSSSSTSTVDTGGGELPERRSKQKYGFTTLLQLFSV